MTDTTHSPEENLAFLRQLATAGKDAPLMAGPYLIAGGGWFGAASLIQWPPIRELLGLDFGQAILAWLLAALGFAIHLTVLIRRDRGKVENSANRTVNAAWTGVGYGIFAFWLGVAAMAYQRGDGFVMNTISLQVLSVYGIAWTIAAAATGHGWMKANAFFALLTVPVLGLFVGTGQEYLIYAIALVLTAVVPGVRLVRLAQQKQG
ncbi:MAG: hypothetical protein EBZ91_13125 [Gammaproteobacteria bacterium]|nr:hypothetical protein [Gammaproteobacteria bacterium]